MIQAIVEGTKTQTRRLSGLDEINKEPSSWIYQYINPDADVNRKHDGWLFIKADDLSNGAYPTIKAKPRYHIGETVYIKEAWRIRDAYVGNPYDFGIEYALDGEIKWWTDNGNEMNYPIDEKLRSPMFLPEMFARYHIQIIGVEPQRLHEITEDDAIAEGTKKIAIAYTPFDPKTGKLGTRQLETYRHAYAGLWDSINKDYQWDSNPWVWKYTFKVK